MASYNLQKESPKTLQTPGAKHQTAELYQSILETPMDASNLPVAKSEAAALQVDPDLNKGAHHATRKPLSLVFLNSSEKSITCPDEPAPLDPSILDSVSDSSLMSFSIPAPLDPRILDSRSLVESDNLPPTSWRLDDEDSTITRNVAVQQHSSCCRQS